MGWSALLQSLDRLADSAEASALFAPLAEEEAEVAAFVFLDAEHRVLGMREERAGYRDRFDVPVRDVVADVLRLDARGVVMAHNHPSGNATPSNADREATRLLARALDPLGVRLLDHLVVARSGVTSFRALGLL
ncbi:JAB domain-containing protein [Sphingomonas sp.]|uniref:JAB domain-containing protein n=1 Tax=Sphingomonas sp. TaxID=28214 RepID=UPI001B2F554A|nr:JAB domain-containing protein [Sphingomonas sp.]MBO9713991.1 DNA repair protein [Sphingomonas sp.]